MPEPKEFEGPSDEEFDGPSDADFEQAAPVAAAPPELPPEAARIKELQRRMQLIGRTKATPGQAVGAALERGASVGLSPIFEGLSEAYTGSQDRLERLRDAYDRGEISALDMVTEFYKGIPKSYAKGRDTERARYESARESQPKTVGVTETLAGLPAAIATGGAGPIGPAALGAIQSFGSSRNNIVGGDLGSTARLAGETALGGVLGKLATNPVGATVLAGAGLSQGDEADKAAILTGLIPGLAGRVAGKVMGDKLKGYEGARDVALGEAQRLPKVREAKSRADLEGVTQERIAEAAGNERERAVERADAEKAYRQELEAETLAAENALETAKLDPQLTVRKKTQGEAPENVIRQQEDILADEALRARLTQENEAAKAAEAQRKAQFDVEEDARREEIDAKNRALHEAVQTADEQAKLAKEAKALHDKEIAEAEKRAQGAEEEAASVQASAEGKSRQAYQMLMDRWKHAIENPEVMESLTPKAVEAGEFVQESYGRNANETMIRNDPRTIMANAQAAIETARQQAGVSRQEAEALKAIGFDAEAYALKVLQARAQKEAAKRPASTDPAQWKVIAERFGIDPSQPYDPKRAYFGEFQPREYTPGQGPKIDVGSEVKKAAAERQIKRVQEEGTKQPLLTERQVAQRLKRYGEKTAGAETDLETGSILDDPQLRAAFEKQRQAQARADRAAAKAADTEGFQREVGERTAKSEAKRQTRTETNEASRQKATMKAQEDLIRHAEEGSPEFIRTAGERLLEAQPVGAAAGAKALLTAKTNPMMFIRGALGGNNVVLNKPEARVAFYGRLVDRLQGKPELSRLLGDAFLRQTVRPTVDSVDRKLALLFKAAEKNDELAAEIADQLQKDSSR